MPDFLLELRCEEIPARMQAGARAALEKLFREQMLAAGVEHGDITVWSTPRRLALIARDLPEATQPVRDEVKGPKTTAPEQALAGFLRKTGLSQDQLEDRNGTWFAVTEKPGRASAEVLAEAIPAIVRAFPWPKSMRWGEASLSSESLRWVRPLSGIVATLGEELVACEVGGVRSAYATLGHRFHHPGPITIGSAGDYQEKLRACHVIVDHAEREALIRTRAAEVAADAGLALVADEGLVVENAGLTEWPVSLLGRFDQAFLAVPPEVIQLTARTNQKYFVCQDGEGRLANAFVCTANIEAADDGEAIIAGNRKVLAARLADAKFFWEQDRKKTLAQHAEKLGSIVFHEKLGTLADKVERVAKLAEWLAVEGIVPGCDPKLARQAAELCKADLVTEMVGEFPELQGVMGGYYARAEGLPDAVAEAIRNHYKPVGQGDEVPTAPVTVAVSLADKLDTICAFFAADEKPSGSKDPYALRRATVAAISLIKESALRVHLSQVTQMACQGYADLALSKALREVERLSGRNLFHLIDEFGPARLTATGEFEITRAGELGREVVFSIPASDELRRADQMQTAFLRAWFDLPEVINPFFADRLKVQQRERGVRHDLIDAVFALGGEDDLVRLLSRVEALQAFIASGDGANLLTAYKRAANILKKESWTASESPALPPTGEEDPLVMVDDPALEGVASQFFHETENLLSYEPEPAERALIDALDLAEPKAHMAIVSEDFAGAMAALASLRGPIDAFFDTVTVNDPDPVRREARLTLLARFRDAVHQVADFSRIEG
jgi:glycyl-tRNA synthetase beta chain